MKIRRKKLLIVISVIIGVVTSLYLSKAFSYTPSIVNGISEFRQIELGGIQQTIMIRGENLDNPILLYLHGGPGTTELIPFRLAHRNLEKYFTIVSWEQRGTGKSYNSNIMPESMSVEQFIADTHQLTEYLLKSFSKTKLLLVGHSWGSALGLLTANRYPELYYAFVGSGQEVKPAEGESIAYEYLVNVSKNNDKAKAELIEINIPNEYPFIDENGRWFEDVKTQRKWLIALGGELYNRNDYLLLFNANTIFAPEYTWIDFIGFAKGSVFSLKTMWPQILNLDFEKQIPRVNFPIFFLQGKYDYNTPTILVQRYFNLIKAPQKELFIFEKSGHMPMYEEPEKYDKILIENVLPLCR